MKRIIILSIAALIIISFMTSCNETNENKDSYSNSSTFKTSNKDLTEETQHTSVSETVEDYTTEDLGKYYKFFDSIDEYKKAFDKCSSLEKILESFEITEEQTNKKLITKDSVYYLLKNKYYLIPSCENKEVKQIAYQLLVGEVIFYYDNIAISYSFDKQCANLKAHENEQKFFVTSKGYTVYKVYKNRQLYSWFDDMYNNYMITIEFDEEENTDDIKQIIENIEFEKIEIK